jgi:hypothetical protein
MMPQCDASWQAACLVQKVLEARHRPGAQYRVETLTAILNAAENISLILSLVLVLVESDRGAEVRVGIA